jgi:DNA modification methylase
LDGSDEVLAAFPETSSGALNQASITADNNIYGQHNGYADPKLYTPNTGSAARFFYHAKANKHDRAGSKHPTVKPVDLIAYLVRLITPPGGLVLDPFAGTGTTGEAAIREGMRAILIEREEEYLVDIKRRLELVYAGRAERKAVAQKARGKTLAPLPLFD